MLIKIILLVIVLLYSAGLFYGGTVWSRREDGGKNPDLRGLNNPESPHYIALQGSVAGKITEVKDGKVYIETKRGGKSIFSLSEKIVVNEIKNGEVVTLGNNIESIKLNHDSTMIVKGYKNGFAIDSITYVVSQMPLMGQMPELNN